MTKYDNAQTYTKMLAIYGYLNLNVNSLKLSKSENSGP